MSSSSKLNSISQAIVTEKAIDNMDSNNAVLDFAKSKTDKASIEAVKGYHRYRKLSLLFLIVMISILFVGIFVVNKQYTKLNDPGDLKYKYVVNGYINNETGMVDYVYNMRINHYPISRASWISDLNFKNKAGVNVYLDDNFEPIYMSKHYNKYSVLFIFVPMIIILSIIGLILINKLTLKKFADYKNWYIYAVLPISDNPKFETLVENIEYKKFDFSLENLNTKAAKSLKKANRVQIICGIILLIIFPMLFTIIIMTFGGNHINGLSFFEYLIVIIISLPFVIFGVNASYKARALKGVVAEQYYRKIYANDGVNKKNN